MTMTKPARSTRKPAATSPAAEAEYASAVAIACKQHSAHWGAWSQ